MRLFIALTLPDPLHAALEDTMARLRADGVSGRFTRPENLHLTLHFLGEQPEAAVDTLSDILLQVPRDAFPLTLSALGTFSRTGILWAGLSPSPALNRLQKQLGAALARAGFPVEARAFRPHLTLVREFRLFIQKGKKIQSLEIIRMIFGSNHRFQGKTADIIFVIAVKAIGSLVFYRLHGIVVRKITLKFIVLGNSLVPFMLLTERFANQENCFCGTLLVLGETFQYTGTFFDDLVVLLAFFGTRQGIFTVGNAVETCRTHFTGLFIQAFRIEHMVQIGTTSTPLEHEGEHYKCHVADT